MCQKWNGFRFILVQARVWLIVIDGRRICSSKRGLFFFLVIIARLFDEAICPFTAKQHSCWFLVFDSNIRNVAALFALQ